VPEILPTAKVGTLGKLGVSGSAYPFLIYWQLANSPVSCVKIRAAFVARIALPCAVF